jgi:PKD repeat protein
LTVIDTSYISNISCKNIAIATTSTNNCKADFNFNIIDSIHKTAIFSDVSLGNPNKREWDFGDNSLSSDSSPKHPYAKAGFYLVSLKINTNTGCSDKTYKLLNVNQYNVGLKAAFGYDVDTFNSKAGGYPVDFIGAGLGDQSRLRWTFGDGSMDSSSTTPTHVYYKNGEYQVCYEISDPVTGEKDSACQTITVNSIVNVKHENNLQYSLDAYPNPFGSYTNIVYSLDKGKNIELSAYDLNGRKLETIVNTLKAAGKYTLTWNTEKFANGVYYLQLRTSDGKVATRIIMKH